VTTVSLPSVFQVTQFSMPLTANARTSSSPYGGSEQIIDLLNDRWKIHLEVGVSQMAIGAAVEAFIASLRNGVNVVNLYHYARPTPRGTMRGTLTLSTSAAIGAAALTITGGAGQASTTLLAGDIVGVGGLLVMVQDDATANGSGVITVNIVNRLRIAASSGAPVTWNQPIAPFRVTGNPAVLYVGTRIESVAFDFVEAVP
jgi:hypothetical protein